MSSSEEADSFNSFVGARRSRKYTSKRSFKDYLTNKNREVSSSERSFTSEMEKPGSENLAESICSDFTPKSPRKISKHTSEPSSPRSVTTTDTLNSSNASSRNDFEETVIYQNSSKKFENELIDDVNSSEKYTKDMEMKQSVEPSEDWYASASDMEETENEFSKLYGQSAGNPVLECMNQVKNCFIVDCCNIFSHKV